MNNKPLNTASGIDFLDLPVPFELLVREGGRRKNRAPLRAISPKKQFRFDEVGILLTAAPTSETNIVFSAQYALALAQ